MKSTNLIIVGIIAILLLATIPIFIFTISTSQTSVVFKSTKQKCIDRIAESLEGNPRKACEPCFQFTEDILNCILENKKTYSLEGEEITQYELDEFLDGERHWIVFCYLDDEIVPTHSWYEPEAFVIKKCVENPEFDYGNKCERDSDCGTPSCKSGNLIKPDCSSNFLCTEQEIKCEFGCEDNKCKPECNDGELEYHKCPIGFKKDLWIKRMCINNEWKDREANSCFCEDNSVCEQGFICKDKRCELESDCSKVSSELKNDCCIAQGFDKWDTESNKCINEPINFLPIIAGAVIVIFITIIIFIVIKNKR